MMKYALLSLVLFYIQPAVSQSPYLKIQAYGENYFAYPPDTEFDVFNDDGEVIFSEKDLSANYEIELESEVLLKVYTDWGAGVDKFPLDQARISLAESEKYDPTEWTDGWSDGWSADQPKVVTKHFSQKKDGSFDARLEFEGDIQFEYKNGTAHFMEKGKKLDFDGKYVAETSQGFLKLSYDPTRKEYWYVFTKDRGKRVYKN